MELAHLHFLTRFRFLIVFFSSSFSPSLLLAIILFAVKLLHGRRGRDGSLEVRRAHAVAGVSVGRRADGGEASGSCRSSQNVFIAGRFISSRRYRRLPEHPVGTHRRFNGHRLLEVHHADVGQAG
jgi:hypothetical protein